MGFVLDCETEESTERSLSAAFRCMPEDLYDVFDSLDLDLIYASAESPDEEPNKYLLERLSDELNRPELPEQVSWFHFTRTLPGNEFTEGLLPLGKVLPQIWKLLIDTAPSAEIARELQSMQKNGVSDFQYNLKAPDSFHWGPFAYLVPEIALHSQSLSQHDYLGMPEIVEDICNGLNESAGFQLFDHFRELLKPCIVKFVNNAHDRGQDTLETACAYLYGCRKREGPSSSWITCFDAGGETISASAIASVRFLTSL